MKKGTVFQKTLEKRRKMDELAKQGKNANEAATILKMSTRDTYKYYQEKGYAIVPYNQKFQANYDIFEEIDTEEKAYWLGFFYADGNVQIREKKENHIQRGYSASLRLHVQDIKHLYKFKDFIGTTSPVVYEEKKAKNGAICHQCVVSVHSKKLCQDLIKWGCVPRKSLILKFPDKLPKQLINHFVRGYFDGDGHISREERRIELIGTKQFLEYIVNYYNLSEPNWGREGKAYCFWIYGENAQKLINEMYYNATVFLDRKYFRCKYIQEKLSYYEKIKNIAIEIYKTGALEVEEVISITGVPQTTLYRALEKSGIPKRRLSSDQKLDICTVEDCDNKADRKNMCQKHYTRWYRYGDVHFSKYNRR